MQSAVEFRILSNKLTNTEYDLFTRTIFVKYGKRQFVDTLITHLLIHEVKNNNNSYTNEINNTISSIIDQRDLNTLSNNENQQDNHMVSIEDLSSCMISYCASFLTTNEIIDFIYCNRYIYTSCVNTTFTFTEIKDSQWLTKYMTTYGLLNYNQHKFMAMVHPQSQLEQKMDNEAVNVEAAIVKISERTK
eukprot:529734_1